MGSNFFDSRVVYFLLWVRSQDDFLERRAVDDFLEGFVFLLSNKNKEILVENTA